MRKVLFPCLLALLIIACLSFSGCSDKLSIQWEKHTAQVNNVSPKLKVYIENSGSMDGYMCDGSELKDAVYGYVSMLNNYVDTIELNYLNSNIIAYRNDLKSFIHDLNPASFKKAGGNRTNSDIASMIEKILMQSGDKTISVFVSDCILDVPDGDASQFFINRQIDIRNAFAKYLKEHKNVGVQILCLESHFTGNQYYNGGSEYIENQIRPYYMWIIGSQNLIAKLNKKVPLDEIQHGVKDYVAFATFQDVPFDITNKFNVNKNAVSCECVPDRDNMCRINVKADLSRTLQRNDVLCNKSTYTTLNNFVKIEKIDKIADKSSIYTHLITLILDYENMQATAERIILKKNDLPNWVEQRNGISAKQAINNKGTTGIKYIIGGVADAYKDIENLAEIKFTMSNK